MDASKILQGLIYPEVCVSCRRGEPNTDLRICAQCTEALRATISPWCTLCGGTADGTLTICTECLNAPRRWQSGASCLVFTGLARQLLHRFKYNGDVSLSPFFGMMLAQVWSAQPNPGDLDALVPVPLHWYRELRRGYNQSQLAATILSQQLNIPVSMTLKRNKHTRPQASLSLAQRRRNLSGSFGIRKGVDPKGLNLLLIDDVFTTGSTLDACTHALQKAGAKSVRVLTIARG